MRDVVVLAVVAGFVAVCVAYIAWCDRIIGPDPGDLVDGDDGELAVDAAAAETGVEEVAA